VNYRSLFTTRISLVFLPDKSTKWGYGQPVIIHDAIYKPGTSDSNNSSQNQHVKPEVIPGQNHLPIETLKGCKIFRQFHAANSVNSTSMPKI